MKCTALGKSRLTGFAGAARPQLAFAFALDTVAAAVAVDDVDVAVVTNDRPVATRVAAMGARVVPDPDHGLNAAYRAGADTAPAGLRIAGLQGDLPALRTAELAAALAWCEGFPTAFVADGQRVGTTLYAAVDRRSFQPRFGGRSRRRHLEAGAQEAIFDEAGELAGLRRDVDTGDDLLAAARLGLGPNSAAAMGRLQEDQAELT